jgi:hypothetical protein
MARCLTAAGSIWEILLLHHWPNRGAHSLACAGYARISVPRKAMMMAYHFFSFAFTHQIRSDTVFFKAVYSLILERIY